MPLEVLCDVHEIDILEPTIRKGSAFSDVRTYDSTRRLRCRVMPNEGGTSGSKQLMMDGYEATHEVWFLFDPLVSVSMRFRFPVGALGSVFRIDPPENPHNFGRIWICKAVCRSEDNPTKPEPATRG